MDKNKLIAIPLIVALYLGFIYFSNKEQEKYLAQKEAYEAQVAQQQLAAEQQQRQELANPKSDEQLRTESASVVGDLLAEAKVSDSEVVKVSNSVLDLEFNTRGGQITSAVLKNYTKYADNERNELVEMFDPQSAMMDLTFYIRRGNSNVRINTMEYNFVAPIQRLLMESNW